MTCEVPAQLDIGLLPSAQRQGIRGKTRVDPEIVKKPIRIKRKQVPVVSLKRSLERASREPHL
jgi:hypothetical protein